MQLKGLPNAGTEQASCLSGFKPGSQRDSRRSVVCCVFLSGFERNQAIKCFIMWPFLENDHDLCLQVGIKVRVRGVGGTSAIGGECHTNIIMLKYLNYLTCPKYHKIFKISSVHPSP